MPNFKVPAHLKRVEPDLEKWPVNIQSKNRLKFIHKLNRMVYQNILEMGQNLGELVNKCVQQETLRIKRMPWKVDPPNDTLFWNKVRKDLNAASEYSDDSLREEKRKEILRKIIKRYSQEIVGSFKSNAFRFARIFTHSFFSIIYNTAFKNGLPRNIFSKSKIYQHVRLYGYVEEVQEMYNNDCVIVIVPTHISNLDSPLLGYILDFRAGLPAFNYGAGLNLFNSEIAAYFMNRLGAYRIDRRKRNVLYLETLKKYSELAVREGINTLFFTGGTRSRSGAIEQDLKLGLLSTLLDAQRELLKGERKRKVIIVPMILSYHFTFEAEFLIEQYLRINGKEKYIQSKKTVMNFLDYLKLGGRLLTKENEVLASFGRPIDVFGNTVNTQGQAFDRNGREINIQEYFMSNGHIIRDNQREGVYTKELGNKISEIFMKDNIVLSSHALAYSIFNYWHTRSQEELYDFLRTSPESLTISMEELKKLFHAFVLILKQEEENGTFHLAPEFDKPIEKIIEGAVKKIGMYHKKKTLKLLRRKKLITTESLKQLLYYHNRLTGYNLEVKIKELVHR